MDLRPAVVGDHVLLAVGTESNGSGLWVRTRLTQDAAGGYDWLGKAPNPEWTGGVDSKQVAQLLVLPNSR